MWDRVTRASALIFLYAATTAFLVPLFFVRSSIYVGPRNYADAILGIGKRPYVYRDLVPRAVRFLVVHTQAIFVDRNPVRYFGGKLLESVGAPSSAMAHAYEYAACAAVIALGFIGFGWFLGLLIRRVYPEYPRFVSDLAPVVALSAIPILFFQYHHYLYDSMTLFLWTLCTYLIVRRSHLLYCLVFPLAVWNKETAALLILLFLLREAGVSSRLKLAGLGLWQVLSLAAVRLWLVHAFQQSPGAPLEYHLLDHNSTLLLRPSFCLGVAPVVALAAILVGYRWNEKPLLLRRGLIVCGVPLLALLVFFGYLDEMRDFYEIYPLAFLLALPTVVRLFGVAGPVTTPVPGGSGG